VADGPFAGYPRVFGLAWAYIAHTDSHFDADMLCRFVRAYQEIQPLTIGELWAIAITLRIVLVENLRRVAELIMHSSAARLDADEIADRLLGAGGRSAEPASIVLTERAGATLSASFAVQLVHRLRDQDPRITPALTWLDQHLATQGCTAESVVRDEHQKQGAGTVTVRNIITSMRLIADVDWNDLFERISLVNDTLAADSSFRDMDFPTRNLYRSAIEALARGANCSELDVARAAVLAAKQAAPSPTKVEEDRCGDPGYYLLVGGRQHLEAAIGFRPPLSTWPRRLCAALGIGCYVAAGATVAAVVLALPLFSLYALGLDPRLLGLLGVLGAIPAIDVAVAFVNRTVTRGLSARPLPALALRDGVPAHLRTVVGVPTLLTTVASIEEQIEALEVHHLASPEGDLHFALLSDWRDAATEQVDGDAALLETAIAGIARLNRRYGPAPGGDRFLLLHRRRIWNAGEARWMGWERKRGKLHELNRLLRGATDTNFVSFDGHPPAVPAGVRYVITLDADTRLPRDTVHRLIGKMAHKLNRPRFDDVAGRVVAGYAVLQPRVTPALPIGREGSLFQRIFSSMNGIDPYAAAVSDAYQDLFGEGSYAGKGIYDIDAFEAALAGRVPDSTLLSHDLFEGIFARAGLASDIEVVEDFPARYDVAALRHHRWARGDWQLLPWILGRGPVGGMDGARGALPAAGRWKMLDNLRRTLSAPTCIIALLAGLTLPFAAASVWTGFILLTILLPALIPVISAVVPRHGEITLRSHLHALGSDLSLAFAQTALTVTFLAHQAWLMDDAITRTLLRLYVTHRHLLEWVPAAQATIGPRLDLFGFYRVMYGGIVFGVLALLDQSRSPGRRPDVPAGRRRSGAATYRTADLAVLRDVRYCRRPHAPAGQFPGRSGPGTGPSHLADQSWPLPPIGSDRARFRVVRNG
jgi:cyclic beta-1,2-glucan synthetase